MKKVILASNNKHKLKEIKEILRDFDYELITMEDAGLVNLEIVEDGQTFEENSYIKAKTILDKLSEITIADDSGLMVEFLDGEPGVYSARYAGDEVSYEDNNKKLINVMSEVPFIERNAKFVSVITMMFPSGEKIVARGEVHGYIALKEAGADGFGYDPLFYIPELKKTFAELSLEEKNEISHRAVALKLLKEKLKNKNG